MMTIQTLHNEWPLVISIVGMVLVIIGAVWKLGSSIGKKLDKVEFNDHVKSNDSEFKDIQSHISSKVALRVYEIDQQQLSSYMAQTKQDIDNIHSSNQEFLKLIGDMATNIGTIKTDIDWIKRNLKC